MWYMKKIILFLAVIFCNFSVAQEVKYFEQIDRDYALSFLLKLDGIKYTDSTVTFDFHKKNLEKDLFFLKNNDDSTFNYNQLHPIYVEAIKALTTKNIKLEYKLSILETTLSNLEIELLNKTKQINYRISNLENEIVP